MGATLRLSTFLLFSVLCIGPALAADTFRDDLRYVPTDAVMVAGFEPWPADDDGVVVRNELLASIGQAERVRVFEDVLAGARRVLLFAVAARAGERLSLVCVVRTERPAVATQSLPTDVAFARADAGTLLVGEPAEVQGALARHRSRDGGRASTPPFWTGLLAAADGATAWGLLTPAGSCGGGTCRRGDESADKGSFTRSLAGLEWWTFSLRAASGGRLIVRTHVRTAEDAEVLADGLRGFFASRRFDARREPEEIRAPLEHARVQATDHVVDLHLPSTGPLLRRLCRKDGCEAPLRSLLTWRLGLETREADEHVTEVVRRLRVAAGEHVADIGSGLGFYTARLARTVGREGQAIAVEIDDAMVTELRRRALEGLPQMRAVLGTVDDPRLAPESLDAVLIVNAYHEMPEYRLMLERIRRALRPGGRLMLVEPFAPGKRGEPRDVQTAEHVLAPELAEHDLREAGFRVVDCDETFVKNPGSDHGRWLLLAERP